MGVEVFYSLDVEAFRMLTDIKSSLLKSETGYVLVNVSDKNLSTKWISIYDEDAKNKPMSQRKNIPSG